MFKIETYLPESSLEDIRKALLDVDAGHIGNYRGCMSYYPVTGVWFSEDNSTPYIGKAGEWSKEQEIKIEFNIEDDALEKTIKAIRKVHPYEEPVINIIKLWNF